MRKGKNGVEGAELGHPEVEALGGVAEDDGTAGSPDDQAEAQAEGEEKQGEAARRAVLDEVGDEEPGAGHEGERARHAGEMEDDDQRQMGQRREVAEQDPEHK